MRSILHNRFFRNTQSFPFGNRLPSAILTFIENILSTRLLNSRSTRGPLFITWLCTFRCNANCRMCSTAKMNKRYPECISLADACRIAHEIGKAKTWVVGFTGGEVLLWPHLFEVNKILKSYGVTTYIVTNGWLLKEFAQVIVDAKIDTVVVSVDSTDQEVHDLMRDRPGLYQRLFEGIELLKTLRSGARPIIKATTILTQQSVMEIDTIVEKLSKIADVTSLQPIISDHENHPNTFDPETAAELIPQRDHEPMIRSQLEKLGNLFPTFKNSYFKSIPDFWFHPERLAHIKCWSPFVRLQIYPNGDVFHCAAKEKWGAVGNLRSLSIMEVWNSPEMRRQREIFRQHKNACICWTQDSSFNAFLDSIPLLRHLPVWNKKQNLYK